MPSRSRGLSGSAGSALDYYKNDGRDLGIDRVPEYHHASGGKVFTQAWGTLAEELGIQDGVTREQFEELWAGRWDGEQHVRPGANLVNKKTAELEWVPRTSAFDVFATTPKSMSELLVKSSPAERRKIADDWIASLKEFVDQGIESDALLARVPVGAAPGDTKQQGSKTERVPAKIVAFPVVEYIARPTEEQIERGSPPDPHLHAHVIVMSLCKVDDKWLTGDEYGLKVKRNSEYRDQLLNNGLTKRLEGRGIEIEYGDFEWSRKGKVSWEVKGSDPKLRQFWSTNGARAATIRREYEMANGHPMSDKALTAALSHTRLRKSATDREQDHKPVFELWADDAQRHGFKMAPVARGGPVVSQSAHSLQTLQRRLEGANGLHRADSTFRADDVKPAVFRCGVGLGLTNDQLHDHAERVMDGLVLVREANQPAHRYFTTNALLAKERAVLDYVNTKADRGQLVTITGPAGTGKSSSIAAAVADLRGDLRPKGVQLDLEQEAVAKAIVHMLPNGIDNVISVSMAAATGERTGKKIHADFSGSIEALVANSKVRLGDRTLVVVDEAAQLDTFRMDLLAKRVGHAPKIVLAGDSAQLVPIGPGGWFDASLVRNGSEELTVVRRHSDPEDIKAYTLIRTNHAHEGLANLAARGRVHVSEDLKTKIQDMMLDHRGFRNAGWQARDIRMIIDGTNESVDLLNRFCQFDRLERGEIHQRGFQVTDEEQGRTWELHEGDQVVMLAVYSSLDKVKIRNGKSGVIMSLDTRTGTGRVKIEGETHRFELDSSAHTQPFGLAYAQHAQKFQGHEVAIVQLAPSPAITDAHTAASTLTRSTQQTHTYLDHETFGPEPIRTVGDAWSQGRDKTMALDKLRVQSVKPAAVGLRQFQDAGQKVRAISYAGIIEKEAGPEVANRFVRSDGFKPLVMHLEQMERRGIDVRSPLRRAARNPELVRSADPATDLRFAVDREIGHSKELTKHERIEMTIQSDREAYEELQREMEAPERDWRIEDRGWDI